MTSTESTAQGMRDRIAAARTAWIRSCTGTLAGDDTLRAAYRAALENYLAYHESSDTTPPQVIGEEPQ